MHRLFNWPATRSAIEAVSVTRYLSSGESMRVTAQKVIHIFGLETFSHTTISRFLRKLYQTALPNSLWIPDHKGLGAHQYIPEHYLELLTRKPRAVINAAPLKKGVMPRELKDFLHQCKAKDKEPHFPHPTGSVLE